MSHKAFITNTKTKTLRKRLQQLIEHSQELKFLIGFFYFSGWQELYNKLKARNDLSIKILVGLDVDYKLGRTIEIAASGKNDSNDEKADRFFESLFNALNTDEMDIEAFYEQVDFFIELLIADRLIIKKTLEPNHAKLYLFKIKDELQGITDCKYITGSSNLTRAGILEQNEFNVEIGDYGTEEAERFFDELWETALPITERPDRKKYLVDFVRNRTQAAIVIPFEAYLLILKTYLDLMEQKTVKPQVIRLLEKKGYINYSYQLDAVNQALTVIDHYNGVIIADVVGLGKSVIAGMVAKHLGRRGMILCPPGLMGDKNAKSGWRKYMHDFELYDWELPINLNKVQQRTQFLAAQIRKILEPVLIRRNRLDLKNDPTYSQEVKNLSEVENPRELFFELTPEQSAFYDEVANVYFGENGQFKGAIYQPFIYEKRSAVDTGQLDAEGNRAYQQQRNLYDFMRRLIVKRFESSFGAFAKSIHNFERVHQKVLAFIENSGGRYILDRRLIEKIYEIEEALEEFAKRLEQDKTPKNDRIYQVSNFDHGEEFIEDIKSDLNLMVEIKQRIEKLNLISDDPKMSCLIEQVKSVLEEKQSESEPVRKVIIFTEYLDAVRYLQPVLEKEFKNHLLYVDGTLTAKLVEKLRCEC